MQTTERSRIIRNLFFTALVMSSSASFGEVTFRSDVTQTSLVELYTSEGCSSCPPADRWLSALTDHAALWSQVVPVAFHVDYWDYIGWKDRFAQPQFADRQRRYAAENSVSTVYTPGLMSNGKEWRNFAWAEPSFNKLDDAGVLTVVIGADVLEANYQSARFLPGETLVANIALLGFGLTSEIKAGENRGRNLVHDFVVLEYVRETMTLNDNSYVVTTPRLQGRGDADRYAIALWVSTESKQAPLQAVGGWLHD